MSDEEFLERFERCDLAEFRHRDHVRLAWLCLRADGWAGALGRIRDGIRRFALSHGATGKYHETMTVAWLAAVAEALAETPDEADFDAFVERHSRLLDTRALLAHYSPERLAGPHARSEWVEP